MLPIPQSVLRRLAAVRSAGFITGAGLSAESGIPTYRGQGGIYDDPEEGDRTIEALTGATFQCDPARTWKAIAELVEKAHGAVPNAGHRALVAIEHQLEHFVLLTQNVDGLHQQAGSANVIDIHGTLRDLVCPACSFKSLLDPGPILQAPRCEECQVIMRPRVVLFGEMLPEHKVQRIATDFYANPPDLVVIAGTSAVFPYIVEPVRVARQKGRLTIEVNPEPELEALVDYCIRAPAGIALPALAETLSARTRVD